MRKILVVLNNGGVEVRPTPEGYQVEVVRLDTIANDPVSEFFKLSTEARELVADEHPHVIKIEEDSAPSECSNCGRRWSQSYVKAVKGLLQRVNPGETMPSGECPICGALCHPIAS